MSEDSQELQKVDEFNLQSTVDGNFNIRSTKDMIKMSKVLRGHIVKQGLFTKIRGKNYAHVDGWQFAGSLLGMIPRVVRIENLSNDKEKKWKVDMEVVQIKDDKQISFGSALCSSKEGSWKDEYAVLSMAQTRAIGKAYRNLLGWIMKLAGYESTPKEEINSKIAKDIKKKSEKNKEKLVKDLKERMQPKKNDSDISKKMKKAYEAKKTNQKQDGQNKNS